MSSVDAGQASDAEGEQRRLQNYRKNSCSYKVLLKEIRSKSSSQLEPLPMFQFMQCLVADMRGKVGGGGGCGVLRPSN